MVFSPSFTFGILLATLYAALAHLILGGGGRVLLFYITASWIGFALGQAIGEVMEIHVLAIGPTNILTATLGAWIALATMAFLSARR